MNYVQLRAAIQQYAQDFEPSFVENVDTFIRLGESRVLLRVRLPRFRKDVAANLTQASNLLALPTDFLAPDSLILTGPDGTYVVLLNKDSEFIEECYPDPGLLDVPRFYAQLNESSIKLGPTPDQAYPVKMGYFYQPPSIVDSGSTWLGDHFAHALITGSLVEAAIYMKAEDNLFQRYDQAFDKDLAMDQQYAKGRTKKDTQQEPDTRTEI
ncbi:MAG TPA: hypothetical protein VKB77_08335 [Terriglobales bacterium]|nr:hypothetical protein [Terriglobales bacterium]